MNEDKAMIVAMLNQLTDEEKRAASQCMQELWDVLKRYHPSIAIPAMTYISIQISEKVEQEAARQDAKLN
jgi:hypothetical protein